MQNKKTGPELNAKLRWSAETIIRDNAAPLLEEVEPLSAEQTRAVIHELRVHQIELKMQNEELQRLQTELELVQAHYFELYHLAPVGYCILSQEGLIREANLEAVTMLCMAHATLIGQPITRFIHKEDQDRYYFHRKKFLATGELHECELRMVKQDGSVFWARLIARSVKNHPERPQTISESCIVLSDITDRKHAEEEKSKFESQLLHYYNNHRVRK